MICFLTIRSIPHCYSTIRPMSTHKVFVYGTLKSNEPNHHWLTNKKNGTSSFITKGTTKTKYPLVIGTKYNIPFLLFKPGAGYNVQGEVYEVDDGMLAKLDVLEDHPNYYERDIDDIVVSSKDDSKQDLQKCWVYFFKNFKTDWLEKPAMECYSSTGPHGLVYMERSKRDPNYDYKKDSRKDS